METGLLILPFAICLAACSLGLPLFIQRRNPRRQCQMGLTAGIAGALVAAAALHVTGFTPVLMASGLCLIGAGMGTIAANAPILVTTGGNRRRTVRRRSGRLARYRAGGMALISTVMLTVLTFLMKYQVQHDPAMDWPPDRPSAISRLSPGRAIGLSISLSRHKTWRPAISCLLALSTEPDAERVTGCWRWRS
jgi:MFS family permease